MKKLICSVIILLAAAMFTSCQAVPYKPYARDVKKKPGQGGVIALKPEHRDEDQLKANQMMSTNCGSSNVKVLEEGEVAVGQEVKSNADTTKSAGTSSTKVGSLFGIPLVSGGTDPRDSTNSSSVTTSIKEWQISYECESIAKRR